MQDEAIAIDGRPPEDRVVVTLVTYILVTQVRMHRHGTRHGELPWGSLGDRDWLDVPRRHLIPSADGPMTNLVLIDLPDHDSTEKTHRMTVDRMVPLVDMLVWVVDPQKYADAALHDGYLKPLAPYADVMVVVLNQSDRLQPDQLTKAMTDPEQLAEADAARFRELKTLVFGTVMESDFDEVGRLVGELRFMAARECLQQVLARSPGAAG